MWRLEVICIGRTKEFFSVNASWYIILHGHIHTLLLTCRDCWNLDWVCCVSCRSIRVLGDFRKIYYTYSLCMLSLRLVRPLTHWYIVLPVLRWHQMTIVGPSGKVFLHRLFLQLYLWISLVLSLIKSWVWMCLWKCGRHAESWLLVNHPESIRRLWCVCNTCWVGGPDGPKLPSNARTLRLLRNEICFLCSGSTCLRVHIFDWVSVWWWWAFLFSANVSLFKQFIKFDFLDCKRLHFNLSMLLLIL